MPTRKIFTRRKKSLKSMHRGKYLLGKKSQLICKTSTETYPEWNKYPLGEYARETYIHQENDI
jgi:vacuolar-type H+-ATPase subunit D/Vma8